MLADRPVRAAVATAVIVSFFVGGVMGGATGAAVASRPDLLAGPLLARLGGKLSAPVAAPKLTVIEESETIAVVEKVNPAVVSIVISRRMARPGADFQPFPFDDFFGDLPPQPETDVPDTGERELRVIGGGSGFLVSADGLIVTNRHVVDGNDDSYEVVLSDGRTFEGKVLARDPLLDLALLDIEGEGFPTVALGDSDALRVGQTVVAVGNALSELANTVTKGIVSGINRRIVAGGVGGSEVIEEAIQTDAAINPGNSGGPLVNLAGEVVGVNAAVNRSAQGVGFAIPINAAKDVVASVREHGRIVRPWIGVRYVLITPEFAKANNLSVTHGALVVRGETQTELAVIPGSPADTAGIKENDIILSVDGNDVTAERSLAALIRGKKSGDQITLVVQSQGKERNVTLTLSELKSQE
ncbi:trypsin-like serine protease [Patescibacteria group bacterium]|nr:MAG: trypsin-like serine protease [Patescibacteria group bacterium]